MATKNVKADNWDGKSRVSNDTYRKRWNEIFGVKEQKEYLQKKCRQAGEAILKQENKYVELEKEYDKVCEERDNLTTILKSNDDTR